MSQTQKCIQYDAVVPDYENIIATAHTLHTQNFQLQRSYICMGSVGYVCIGKARVK